LQLTAIFETWHIPDGNYPPLHTGQLVNLSFEVMPLTLSKRSWLRKSKSQFEQVKDAEYKFAGQVLKVYRDPPKSQIVVVQAGDFRFYMHSFPKDRPLLKKGDRCEGVGRLLLDRYIWVEYLAKYEDPPDLFYGLKVSRIRRVRIPDSFIHRTAKGQSGPTSLRADDYSDSEVQEVQSMDGPDDGWSFDLVTFDDSDVGEGKISRTFRQR
jgi:hypothetical protein